jgi:membrane-associated phospholipid phosphatase
MDVKVIFEYITFFGSFNFIFYSSLFIFSIFFIFFLLSGNNNFFKKFILPFFISVIVTTALVYFSKIFFGVVGPPDRVLYETDYSFPSGHTAGAFIFFSSLYYLLSKKIKTNGTKIFFLLFIFLIILLVSVSRLVLGVHYITDIAGGLVFGLFGLLLNIFVYNLLNKK